MVKMSGTIQQTPYSLMQKINASGNMTLPVKPSQYIYTQFDYVRGVPASANQSTISITKIKILDTMVSHMIKTKQQISSQTASLNPQTDIQADAQIQQFQQQIKATETAAKEIPYVAPTSVTPPQGLLFSIEA